MDTSSRLSTFERWLIALPLAAGVVFGLFPLLAPEQFASLTGFPGMSRNFWLRRWPCIGAAARDMGSRQANGDCGPHI